MNYLVCLKDGEKDYTPITEEAWEKIAQAIRDKAIPPSFELRGKTIVSDTIVGLTDNPVPSQTGPKKTIDELRAEVHQSDWYQRSKKNRQSKPSQPSRPLSSIHMPRRVESLSQLLQKR